MFVKVFRNDIIDGLQKSSAIIPAKTGAAFLRTLWLEAKTGSLRIFSTDSSLEFTGEYSAVVEEEGLVGVQGNQARVAVTDQGPGIPVEERNVLFRRFAHQSTGHDPAKAGAGLGLSVVKAVVEAHGGQVGIEDRPGGGVAFWFTLTTATHSNSKERPVPQGAGTASGGEGTFRER